MEENRVLWLVKQTHLFLEQYGREVMKSEDLTPAQSMMLGYLLSQDREELSATRIHAEAGISRATISSVLKSLRKKGYLLMEEVPEDERKKRILLTERAFREQERIGQVIKERQDCILRGIPRENLDILEKCLEQMMINIRLERDRRNEHDKDTVKTGRRI